MSTLQEKKKRQEYIAKANQTEEKYGLPKNILVGVMGAESNFNPNAVSPVGAKGLMQFMKATAQEYGINPLNPSQAIEAAGKYLASSYKTFGNIEDALMSYNMGVGGLQKVKAGKKQLPKETAEYVGRVYKNAGIDYEEPSYANSVAPYLNQPTPTINYLQIPQQSPTFASAPPPEKDEPQEETDAEVQKVEQESNFLREIEKEDYAHLQPQQKIQEETPQTDYIQQYEQIGQFLGSGNEVAQQGGTAEEKDTQWLQDWYANRVIPNKQVNAEYQKVKGEYEDVSHAIPYPTYTGYISPPSSLVDGRVEGIRTKDNEIRLVSPPNKTTYLHEADHFIDQNLPNTPMQGIHSRIVEQNIAPKEIIDNPYTKDNYEYLSQPTEVHARLQELRKEAGFKPTQEIKEKDFDNFQKGYKGNVQGINDLFQTFDKPHLIEILNTMAYNPKKGKDNVAQQGTTVKTQPPKKFLTEYLNSPKYKERLKSSGYNVEQELNQRKQNLKDATVYQEHQGFFESLADFRFPPEKGSYYDNNTNSVNLDYPETVKGWNELYKGILKVPSKKEVEAHELGHAIVSANGYSVNNYDNANLKNRSTNRKDVNSHDKMSSENKADLDAYRYTLKQEGLYDAGKEIFTKEHLKKQSKSTIKNRLLRNYSEEDLIWLMNNIAQNEKSQDREVQFSQQGGKQKYTENELAFLSEIAIKDQEGQRNHPNKVIEIQGNTMSTHGYGDIPLYIIPNKGKARVIEANTGQHKFKGATKFLEIPIKNAK